MAEVLLFHHVLGLTPGCIAFADQLRAAGHKVHTPDLFSGRTYSTLEEGISFAKAVGFAELLERGVRAADGLPNELVYAGFSFGVMPAQKLAQTRAGARGALLYEACIPFEEFSPVWPENVPVQIHGMDADPFFAEEGDLAAARILVDAMKSSAQTKLFVYPGNQHLFTDSSLASFDRGATSRVIKRTLEFLESR